MSRAGFGKPKYSGNTFKKTGKVVKGDNPLRIAPPMGACAESGTWRVFRVTHWGYAGVSQREPGKTVMRPFLCIQEKNRANGMIKKQCPACVYYDELIEGAKEHEAKLRAGGMKDDEVATAMSSRNERIKALRPEAKWYVNALFQDGSVGDFKLNHKDHMNRIMAIIEGAAGKPGLKEKEGIDALDPDEGVWFVVTRNGDGISPPDSVDLAYEEMDVPGFGKVKRVKRAPLSDAECEKLLKECPDLNTVGGASLTYDQIAAVVKCSGNPEEIDKIFASIAARNTAPTDVPAGDAPADTSGPDPRSTGGNSAATDTKSSAPPADTANNAPKMTEADKQRLQEILKRRAEAAVAEAAKKAAEAAAPPASTMDLNDDDFVAKFGSGALT